MIGEEAHVMSAFAHQPHMCDFGKGVAFCNTEEGLPSCQGPRGTTYALSRLYGFKNFALRTYYTDALKAIFPDKSEAIDKFADPGEFGMEDFYCRLVCCFLFMMAVMDDFKSTYNLCFLLVSIPTSNDKWLRYAPPTWGDKQRVKATFGLRELDLVKFGVAGMPLKW